MENVRFYDRPWFVYGVAAFVAAAVLAVGLALAGTGLVSLADPAARTANGTGSAVDVAAAGCAGKQVGVIVNTTAGSGTVTTYKVSVQGSVDGANFQDVACERAVNGAGTAAANQQFIETVSALETANLATGTCTFPFRWARASWQIAGTTPSETFSVTLTCQT